MRKLFSWLLLVIIPFSCSFGQDLLSQQRAERLYKAGMDQMARSEFGGALQSFDEFLRVSGRDDVRQADASYNAALCGLYLYHADAEKRMADFIENHPAGPQAASAHFDLGNFFYNEKNYTRSTAEYQQVEFHSLSAEQQNVGRFRYAYGLFNQRKLKEALEQFNYIKTGGGPYGPAASYYAGFIEHGQGEYEAALADLRRAEENGSYAKVVPYLIAHALYRQGQYGQVLAYLATIKDKEGMTNLDELALLSAESEFKLNDFKKALEGYQAYLSSRTSADRGILYRAGYSAYSTGQNDVAVQYLKSAASDQDSVGFYSSYYLGVLYLKQNQKPLALTAFDNARKLKTDPRLAEESSYQYSKIAYDLGQPETAIPEFEKFLKDFPRSGYAAEVRELLSRAYVNANNFNRAIEYIESLPARSPAIDRAYQKATYLKGADLFNNGDYAQAVQYFEKSLQFPLDAGLVAEANFWCAEAFSVGKKYPEAAARYETILGLPSIANEDIVTRTRYGLGYAYFNQKKYDRALYNFREFIARPAKIHTLYGDGVLRLADCYYVTKDYGNAVAGYKKAIDAGSPDVDYAHLQMGVIYGILVRYADAERELDVVVQNFPQSTYVNEAIFQHAQLDFEQGNYGAAVTGYSRIIDNNKPSPFLPYAYQRRAAAYYNLKEYDKTAADYAAVLEKFPSHPVAGGVLLPLQEALKLANRSGDFDKYLAEYKAARPDAKEIESVEFEAAKNLYFQLDYEKALSRLTAYIDTYPASPRKQEAKYYKAESLYRLKNSTAALAAFADIDPDPSFAFANKVTGRMAELEFKAGSFEKAVTDFRRLAKNATTKKDQSSAWSGLMESFFLLSQYDSCDFYARLILEKGKVNAGAENKASLFLGKSAMARGDYETAKDEFLTTLNSARDEFGAEAKFSLAMIFHISKDYKSCYETLVSLNSDFSEYAEWVGKSYLLMADNYLAMGETFQAKGTLKSLIDNFPLQPVKDQARDKLRKIEDEEAKKQAKQEEVDSTNNKKN